MVRQMWNTLQDYKKCKAGLDKRYQESENKALYDCSERYLKEVWKPIYETAYNKQARCLKGAAIDQIERLAVNAEIYVDSVIGQVNYFNILSAQSLKDVPLTEMETQALLKRFSNDLYASRVFIGILNGRNDERHQRPLPNPEATLATVNNMVRDAATLINSYSGINDMKDPLDRIDYINVKTIESRFLNYSDILNKGYFSDSQLDITPPLTVDEEKEVDNLFSGYKDSYSKRERAAELARQGYASLILRSQYADSLPRFYKEAPRLDDVVKNAIVATEEATHTALEMDKAREFLGGYADFLDIQEERNPLDILSEWSKDHGFSDTIDSSNTSINADTSTDNAGADVQNT